jgi:hypothetical protein
MPLIRIILRVTSGALGLVAGFLAIFEPLLFVANELQEMKSYDGPISIPGAIGGSLLVLGVALLLAFASYFLLRYAFRGNKLNGRLLRLHSPKFPLERK